MEWLSDIWASVSVQSGYILRIVIAAICGGAIGIERTLRQKDAGFRTHVIVAIGSSLMMVISKYGFSILREQACRQTQRELRLT
jgi:putative Mg2+ transporter-C (MgtC) family protein